MRNGLRILGAERVFCSIGQAAAAPARSDTAIHVEREVSARAGWTDAWPHPGPLDEIAQRPWLMAGLT
jgi:hypothetical protein